MTNCAYYRLSSLFCLFVLAMTACKTNSSDTQPAATAPSQVSVINTTSTVQPATATLDSILKRTDVMIFFHKGMAKYPSIIEVNRQGRYVRVQLSNKNYLSVAELQVFDANGKNVALGAKVSQSSDMSATEGSAQLAIDNNTNGDYSLGSVSHTAEDAQAWLELDLGDIKNIKKVAVWNREFWVQERLSNFYLLVSETPFR